MREQFSRRGFVGLCGTAGAAVLLTATGCSSDDTGDATGTEKPVTIRHMFGETIVPAPPTRVVCAGYTGQDDLLALGVVPIALTDWFGGQPFGVWPWAQPLLRDAKPVLLSLDDGIPVKKIAELKPDLIVATNAGVDEDTYRELSAIAPTLPQSGGAAFFEPWKVQAAMIGEAVHRARKMRTLIDGVDAKFADVASAHAGFADKKVLLLAGRFEQDALAVTTGWRTGFLTSMGLSPADAPAAVAHDQLRSVLGGADVLIWATESDDERNALLAEPDIAAVASRSVFTTKDQAGAIAFASPLSYPVVADQLPTLIAKVLG